jgi:hypothetical protein
MATSEYLQALEEALQSPEREVMYQGRKVVYDSVDDLQKKINLVKRSLSDEAGSRPSSGRTFRLNVSKL